MNKHNQLCQIGENSKDCPACQALAAESKKRRANPLENVIESSVCDHAKQLGCLHYKFTSPSRRSVPDRLFILPDGKGVFFIEFKRRGERPTPGQEIEIAKIRAKGISVFVIDDRQDGKDLINHLLGKQSSIPLWDAKQVTMDDPAFN